MSSVQIKSLVDDLWHRRETIPFRATSKILGIKRRTFFNRTAINKELFSCVHVSALLWVHMGSVLNQKKVLKVYFSSILCELSQKHDNEQIWMAKNSSLATQGTNTSFCALDMPFPVLFLSHRGSWSAINNLWKQHKNDRNFPAQWRHAP